MRNYIVIRLATGLVTLFLVSVVIFLLMRVLPGDVARVILEGFGGEVRATETQLQALREQLGLTLPLHVQYANWIANLVTLNWGDSLQFGTSVLDSVKARLPVTFELATLTLIVATVLAVPVGVIAAVRQHTWVDQTLRVFSVAGLAMPAFWTGTLIILGLVYAFKWLPPLGYVGFFDDPLTNLQQLMWPALALGFNYTAIVSRLTRSQMLEVLREDYVRTAWAKGLREFLVVARHALPNAVLPVVTVIGLQYTALLGGTVIMETIFAVPGVGSALVAGIRFKDFPVVQTLVMVFATIIVLSNLIVDLLYAVLDPRVRLH